MNNVIDLAAYRKKRMEDQHARQMAEYDRAVRQSREVYPTSKWTIFKTTYQILIKPRKEDS